jgi:predicted MFS family arabinose efflux permease
MTRTRSQLFLSAFAAQAGFLTLSPILPDVAAEFETSSAAIGQLRTLSGLAGGLVALYLFAGTNGPGLRSILRASLVALLAGSLASAMAPTLAVLVAGQVAVGGASGGLLTGGIAAAARWPEEHERHSVLTWAIVGQPAAWVVGMPLIGVVADTSWRLTWVVLPGAAAVLALTSLANRSADVAEAPAQGTRAATPLAGWASAEFLAFAAWGGTLVYAGALLRESYSISAGTTGLVLGLGAATYFLGAAVANRSRNWRVHLVLFTFALVLGLVLFGGARPGLGFSAVLFGLLVLAAGTRTTLASQFVLEIPAETRLRASGARAAAMQFGYLFGAFLGGLAITIGGFRAMGMALAALVALSAVPHVASIARARRVGALRELYDAGRLGDIAAGKPLFEWRWSQEFPDRPPMHEWLGQWRHWSVEPEGWVHGRNRLVVLTRYRGTGRRSGAPIDAHGAHVWAFKRGRPVSVEIFSDPALALASYLNSGAKAGKRPLFSSDFRALRARG